MHSFSAVEGYRSIPTIPAFFYALLSGDRLEEKRRPNDGAECRYASDEITDTATIGSLDYTTLPPEGKTWNEQRLAQAATEVLFGDPGRRHINGITISGSNLQFFSFSRSHVQCSTGFDFHKVPPVVGDCRPRLTDLQALGYDLSVQRIPSKSDNGTDRAKCDFRYWIEGRAFLTEGDPISHESAYNVSSRATRVWKVKEVKLTPEGRVPEFLEFLDGEKVLKDVWLYEDASLEHDIQGAIFQKLDDSAQQHFLKILVDGVVQLSDGESDITAMCPNEKTEWTQIYYVPSMKVRQNVIASQKPARRERNAFPRMLKSRRRKHVRTVFEGRCESVYELRDFSSFLRCVAGCAKALDLMREAGYVHRDVSAGNCLYDPVAKVGRLADLEYARPYEDIPASEPKVGTPDFMAVEYQAELWLFRDRDCFHQAASTPRVLSTSTDILTNDNPAGGITTDGAPGQSQDAFQPWTRPVFIVHFLHDLESLYWVYVWFLHFRIPHQSSIKLQEMTFNIKNIHDNIDRSSREYFFYGMDGAVSRTLLITQPADSIFGLLRLFGPLYTSCPLLLKPIVAFCADLRGAYTNLQREDLEESRDATPRLPVSTMVTNELYTLFGGLIDKALASLGDEPLPVKMLDELLDPLSPATMTNAAEADDDDRGTELEQRPRKKPKILNNGPATGSKRGG
ncbi:uncharacterized protein BXZ73DRAFT_101409 [Epithele typhae]|uniref:uncharacterized protein n=1 Tax=Epithele typhae TaxID=378194 RepID=UPI0020077649|nr:uncharacterized protein BXZ73DRAFT_101409 [Epithele typhae]KAH9932034.1 hypothetical protein BXZ73DRAFT_101409 [Epithele typhae]